MALVLTFAGLLFAFGVIAQEVAKGKTLAFDRAVMLALRSSTDPSVPVGTAWLPEAARDVTSLGSSIVLVIITLAVVGLSVFGWQISGSVADVDCCGRRNCAQRSAEVCRSHALVDDRAVALSGEEQHA